MGWGCTFITCHRPQDSMPVQMASVSCISGDTEDPVCALWLQALPGKERLGGQHAVLLQERHRPAATCAMHHARADGHGVPCLNTC